MASVSFSSSDLVIDYLRITKNGCFNELPFPLTLNQAQAVRIMEQEGQCSLSLNTDPLQLTLSNQRPRVIQLSVSVDPRIAGLQAAALTRMKELIALKRLSGNQIEMDKYSFGRHKISHPLEEGEVITPDHFGLRHYSEVEHEVNVSDLISSLLSLTPDQTVNESMYTYSFRNSNTYPNTIVLVIESKDSAENLQKERKQFRIRIEEDRFSFGGSSPVNFVRGDKEDLKRQLMNQINIFTHTLQSNAQARANAVPLVAAQVAAPAAANALPLVAAQVPAPAAEDGIEIPLPRCNSFFQAAVFLALFALGMSMLLYKKQTTPFTQNDY